MANNTKITDPNFFMAMQRIMNDFEKHAAIVSTERWQGVETQGRQDYQSKELLNYDLCVPLKEQDVFFYQRELKPNLPWADEHFKERVCGEPINPGVEWANWPWAGSAAKHRNADEEFNHNYMQRYWPKYAGMVRGGVLKDTVYDANWRKLHNYKPEQPSPHKGIRHTYGDLMDVVEYLVKEPHTRQAYLPIFFPEDTGYGDGGRKPCTLGYQFIMRDDRLHVYYPLRSCDFYKHFRDDIYLTIRLLFWVIDQCALRDERWKSVKAGNFSMHMTSFHCFYNDYVKLFGKAKW